MGVNGMFSLLEAAAKMSAFSKNMEYCGEAVLTELAVLIRDKAKESLGSYHRGWPKLAESTLRNKAEDSPLLETGALRDSIGAKVFMHGKEHGHAYVGTDDMHARRVCRTRDSARTATSVSVASRCTCRERHRQNRAEIYSRSVDFGRPRQFDAAFVACHKARVGSRSRGLQTHDRQGDVMTRTNESQKALFDIQSMFPPELLNLVGEWAKELAAVPESELGPFVNATAVGVYRDTRTKAAIYARKPGHELGHGAQQHRTSANADYKENSSRNVPARIAFRLRGTFAREDARQLVAGRKRRKSKPRPKPRLKQPAEEKPSAGLFRWLERGARTITIDCR
jgi:hypothetical protein